MLLKRTPAEWERITGVTIIDPDGWKYRHGQLVPKLYHKKISRREFHRRASYSAVYYKNYKGE